MSFVPFPFRANTNTVAAPLSSRDVITSAVTDRQPTSVNTLLASNGLLSPAISSPQSSSASEEAAKKTMPIHPNLEVDSSVESAARALAAGEASSTETRNTREEEKYTIERERLEDNLLPHNPEDKFACNLEV